MDMNRNVSKRVGLARQVAMLAVCAIAFHVAPSFAQGIPVISVSELAQDLTMAKSLQSQLATMQSQYTSLVGNRGLGQILNNPSLTTYLPSQWQTVYSQVKSGQLQGLSSAAQQVESQEGMTASTFNQQRYNDVLATNKAITMQAYQSSADRLQNIQNLMHQSDLTQDPAAKADLQNRLQSENAMIHLQDVETTLAQKQAAESFRSQMMGDAAPAQ
jgi:type IV secretion system protein VirB5